MFISSKSNRAQSPGQPRRCVGARADSCLVGIASGGLSQKGRDLERVVLSRAVRWHLEHRILCYAHQTVVFD